MKKLILIFVVLFISCKKEDAEKALKAVAEESPAQTIEEEEKKPEKQKIGVFSDIVGDYKGSCETINGKDRQHRVKAQYIDGEPQIVFYRDQFSSSDGKCEASDLLGTHMAFIKNLQDTQEGIDKKGIFFSYRNVVADSRLVCGESMTNPSHTYFPVMEACQDNIWLDINNSQYVEIYAGYHFYGFEMVKL